MELAGRLSSAQAADLLQWAHNDRRTGSLVVRTSEHQKRIFFELGSIVGCSSDNPADYFGQHLFLEGLLDQEQIVAALTHCRANGMRLGVALVELGMLGVEEVRAALGAQIADAVCDLFLWSHGLFYFEQRLPVDEPLRPHPIDAQALAIEGSRWVDELERIRSVFVHDNVVLRPGKGWDLGAATALEAHVVAVVDGPVSLAELYSRVKGNHFRFLSAAFSLAVREVLDIDRVGEEQAGQGGQEIQLFDLLMEQAAQQEVVFTQRHLSLPLEVLAAFYPVWVDAGAQGTERDQVGEGDALALYRSMDGDKSLHELLFEVEGEREARVELILLQLRKGNLALLPRPRAELEAQPAVRRAWLRRLLQR
jgi:hypothetical protein